MRACWSGSSYWSNCSHGSSFRLSCILCFSFISSVMYVQQCRVSFLLPCPARLKALDELKSKFLVINSISKSRYLTSIQWLRKQEWEWESKRRNRHKVRKKDLVWGKLEDFIHFQACSLSCGYSWGWIPFLKIDSLSSWLFQTSDSGSCKPVWKSSLTFPGGNRIVGNRFVFSLGGGIGPDAKSIRSNTVPFR